MSVVIFTAAELVVLGGMLGGLIRKRSHDRQAQLVHVRVPVGRPHA